MKRRAALLLAMVMLAMAIPFSVSSIGVEDFTDVNEGTWYYESVKYVVGQGLMTGVSDDKFDPSGDMTRAMFVTVLGRHAGADVSEYTGSSFSDVDPAKLSWAYKYIEWAKDEGIVSGISESEFDPYSAVTREQMMTFFCRYAGYLGYETDGFDINSFYRFGDWEQTGNWARGAAVWATYFKLIGGTGTVKGTPTLLPKGTASRAQVATVLRSFDSTRFVTTTPIGEILINGNDIGEYQIIYGTKYTGRAKDWKSALESANLLSRYIELSTGQTIPVYEDTAAEIKDKEIIIGLTNREGAQGGIAEVDRSALGRQDYIVKVEGSKLIFTSSEEFAGTLLGTYCFLGDVLGWDFYNFGSYVNHPKNTVSVPDGFILTGKPSVDFRCPIWGGGLDNPNTTGTDVYSANHYDSSTKTYENDGFSWNGRVSNSIAPYNYERACCSGNLVHSLTIMVMDWLNPDGSEMTDKQIAKEYDDRFFNKQLYKKEDPCLTDEHNIENVLKCARAFCSTNKNNDSWFYVCQGDGGTYCTCENCMKVYQEEGSYSGTYVRLLNRVCEELEDDYPNFKFATLAYKHTVIAPKVTKLHKNAMVVICQDTLCHAHNIDDPSCSKNAALSRSFQEWRKITAEDNLFIWDYWDSTGFYFSIKPNVLQYVNRLCYYAKQGVNGYVVQADNSIFAGVKSYLLGLFADKGYTEFEDYGKKMDEYLFHQYGYGYTYIREMIEVLSDLSNKNDFSGWPESPYQVFTADNYFENKDYLNSLIEKARSLATSDYQKSQCEILTIYMDYEELLYTYEAYYELGTYEQMVAYAASVNAFIKKVDSYGLSDTLPRDMLNSTEPGYRTWNGTAPDTWVV